MDHLVLDPVIDPALADNSPQHTENHHQALQDSASPSPVPQPSQRITKTGRPSKARGTVPGSAADFRRREANRLAADRSRSRQAEKGAALENASRILSEENARLKEQIAALEGGTEGSDFHHAVQDAEHQPTPGPSRAGESHDDEQQVSQEGDAQTQEQEAHSHTILAALTDITGVDFSEGNEANWMQGMETFLKDSESGRLGELAAVATGHDDPQMQHQEKAEAPHISPFKMSIPFPLPGQVPIPGTSAAVGLAAALNTEMERIIMEDLALTKAAIVKVENQISHLRARPDADVDEISSDSSVTPLLPKDIFSEDVEVLQAAQTDMQNSISYLESTLPPVRGEFVKTRDDKTSEEKRIIDLVKEVKGLEVREEDQKEKVLSNLRSAGTFVENLLTEEHTDNQYLTGAFSSPALARRRRGRPPKGEVSRTFYQSYLIGPLSQELDLKGKGKAPAAKNPRRSRLGELSLAGHASSHEEDDHRAAASSQDTQTHLPDSHEPTTLQAAQHGQDHPDEQDTTEAVNRAEAYILSHLNASNATDQDAVPHSEREDAIRLESTSFADFLPAQEALERQAEASTSQHGDGDAFGQSASSNGQKHELVHVGQGNQDIPLSVLSRLKQGPPGSCDICMRTETTVWRKLVLGGIDHKVCNACGLYHSKFGVIRPPELWGDGKSLKKRRSARPSADEDDTDIHMKKKMKKSIEEGSDQLEMLDDEHQELGNLVENHLSAQQREEEEAAAAAASENIGETVADGSVIHGAVQPGGGLNEAEGNMFEV
ncbi:hypothetical protein CNI04020 [Cryptococcus gattii WM276]|uniref:GATA-type domain-containing protein n=1 Tax=Cryptococcus gattii serotype B (strain WM276 / ATCC MYA-4071) TaxID=367775 RepID=E6RB24_CRYGW|nr:uncharacterized protein CGB_H4030W [Cryptococcus gattii WM276]ADV24026.1 hypothetical protein CNI04020 [Cryptococcus gattii WM276]KJE03919.1 hypothetical protein I311_02378 [Cryptococcus gattii NT-10]